jgi:uncharacterized protein YbjT (DUF2867 family)
MQQQTAVVIGATGMIGNLVTQLLLNDDTFNKVRILVRKPVAFKHPKLETVIVDFNDLADFKNKLGNGDVIFSCIGTTQKNVKGDKALYRKIDFDIPANAATIGKASGFSQFLMVSSVGANAKGNNFYLRLKGELEQAVIKAGLSSTHIFQPSMLLGDRKENRLGERFFQNVFKLASGIFIGSLRKYRAIEGATVAAAMVNAAKENKQGNFFYVFDEMISLAK